MKKRSKPVLIIKTGSTHQPILEQFGDYDQWIITMFSGAISNWQIYDVRETGRFPEITRYAGAIITGSHQMVTERSGWMIRLMEQIPRFTDEQIPLLGICFGHQLIAAAMGGVVADNPNGLEQGNSTIYRTDISSTDPLFASLPDSFSVFESHYQSVILPPAGAQILAYNSHDPVQAFRIGQTTWGVQFHPEFTIDTMKAYMEMTDSVDSTRRSHLLRQVTATPRTVQLMHNFASIL